MHTKSRGKGKMDAGAGKSGLMAPMGNAHCEKDAGDVECCNLKYAGKDSMDNPERLKKAADGLARYARKHSMTSQYD